MCLVRQLSVSDVRRSRPHLFWIQVIFTVAVVGLLVAEFFLMPETWNRAELGSLPYLIDGLRFTAIALVLLIWLNPVWTLAWMVPVAWLLPYGEFGLVTGWRAVALGCVAALVWVVVRARNGRPAGSHRRPPMDGVFGDSWAFQHARLGWLAVALGVGLMVVLLVVHSVFFSRTADFEERAERAVVEVVSYDDATYQVVVRVDGEEYVLSEPQDWEPPAVGDSAIVLWDVSDSASMVFLESRDDPSWLVGLAVAAPLVGLWLGLPIVGRSRGRRHLVLHGAPANAVRLNCSKEMDFTLHATDGERPFLEVAHIAGLVPSARVAAFVDEWYGQHISRDKAEALVPSPGSVPAGGWFQGILGDIRKLWNGSNLDDHAPSFSRMLLEEKRRAEPWIGPEVGDGEPFVLLGPWSHGSTVALLKASGQAWLAEVREPWFGDGDRPSLRGKARSGFRRTTESGRTVDDSNLEGGIGDLDPEYPVGARGTVREAFFDWVTDHSRWLRWVSALGVAAGCAFVLAGALSEALDSGGDVVVWGFAIVLAPMLMSVPSFALDWLQTADSGRARLGLATYGLLSDEVVARDRFVSAEAKDEAVIVALHSPEDHLFVVPWDVGHQLNSEQAAEQVRLWFASAPADGRSGRRPSPVLVAALLLLPLAVGLVVALPI